MGNWTRVYQSGDKSFETDYGRLRQAYNVQPVLVDLDDIDEFLGGDPKSQAPRLIFSGGTPAWSSEEGDHWDDESTKSVNGVEARRFLTKLRHDAPRVEHGILSFHTLVEDGLRNFHSHETDDHVIRFDEDAWEERAEQSGFITDNLMSMDIQTGYLLDYLDARNAALVLAYFQSRSLRESTVEVDIDDDGWTELEIDGFPAKKLSGYVDGLDERYPHVELHCFYAILPSSANRSAEEEASQNREIPFRTFRGDSYSPDDVENQRGFEDAGLKRPAYGAQSLEEAMSFYDWVFFDMSVLEKYIQSDDGRVNWWSRQGADVAWKDIFSERVYRNDEFEVTLLLDDLAHIPDQEIPHWKTHNIAPSGSIPEEGVKNFILAEPVSTKSYSDQVLNAIESLNETVEERYGNSIFNPLADSDPVQRVIMPARNERDSLLDSMDALNKVFFERIDVSAIQDALPEKRAENINGSKSALFELTAEQIGEETAVDIFDPVNGVYDLRVVADHRSASSKWERGMDSFGISPDTRNYREAYCDIMEQLSEAIIEICGAIDASATEDSSE
ncbi:hypothetical protein [Haloarcula marina]|uniref:hypothetical protein n=1 Tax=Haloarcula marina TaxID=2961574 RepID=UPI0020B7883A|nr:hypothetical protein [Halomicroarcula marina]